MAITTISFRPRAGAVPVLAVTLVHAEGAPLGVTFSIGRMVRVSIPFGGDVVLSWLALEVSVSISRVIWVSCPFVGDVVLSRLALGVSISIGRMVRVGSPFGGDAVLSRLSWRSARPGVLCAASNSEANEPHEGGENDRCMHFGGYSLW